MPFRKRQDLSFNPPHSQPIVRDVVDDVTGFVQEVKEPSHCNNLPDPKDFDLTRLVKAGVQLKEVNTRVLLGELNLPGNDVENSSEVENEE